MSRARELVLEATVHRADRELVTQLFDSIAEPQSGTGVQRRSWRVTRVTVKNLWSISGERTLVAAPGKLTAVVGPNGAGKSAMTVNALMLGLYGAAAAGNGSLVCADANGGARVTVSLEVTAGDRTSEYVVDRSWSAAGRASRTSVSCDGEPVASGVKAVTDFLSDLLGPAALARATWLSAQGEAGRFAASTPRDRFALLADLFGFSEFDEWQRAAKKQAREAQARRDMLLGEQRAVTADTVPAASGGPLAGEDGERLAELQSELRSAVETDQERAGKVAQIEARVQEQAAQSHADRVAVEAEADKLEWRATQLETDVRKAAARVEQLRDQLANMGDVAAVQAAALEAGREAAKAGETARELQVALEADRLRAAEMQRTLSALSKHDGDSCGMCGQVFTAEAAEARTSELRDDLDGLVARGKVRADEAANAASTADAAARQAEQLAATAAQVQAQAQSLRQQLDVAEQELETASQHDPGQLRSQAAAMRAEARDTSERNREAALADREAALAQLGEPAPEWVRTQLDQVVSELHFRSIAIERATAASARLAEVNSKLEAEQRLVEAWEAIQAACGRSGVPSTLIQAVLADVNTQISELLQVADSPVSARIEFEDPDAVNPKLVILATHDEVLVPYDSLSGGQRMLVDLAVRSALTDILSFETGVRPLQFILDEGWGVLDDQNVRVALRMLCARRDQGATVLTVTHSPDVVAAAEATVELQRAG